MDNRNLCINVEYVIKILQGKWKLEILYYLTKYKTLRFSELQKRILKITKKVLSSELKILEKEGFVKRKVYSEVPPRVEYTITPKGEHIKVLLSNITEWEQQNRNKSVEVREEN